MICPSGGMSLWRHRRRFQCSDCLSVLLSVPLNPGKVLSVMSTVLTETSGSVYAVIALFSPAFSAVLHCFFPRLVLYTEILWHG